MGLPDQPVTLTPEQVADLNKQLSTMRHDINNNLSLIMAAIELARLKPEAVSRMINTLAEQPGKIGGTMTRFTAEFEKALGITR